MSPDCLIDLNGSHHRKGDKYDLDPIRSLQGLCSENPLEGREIDHGDLDKKSSHHAVEEKWVAERIYPEDRLKFGTRIPRLEELKQNHRGDGHGPCPFEGEKRPRSLLLLPPEFVQGALCP
jgi:hypothetical protein